MSLNFDVSEVKDFQINFPDDYTGENGVRYWNKALEPLSFYHMLLGMNEITEKNIPEFIFRAKFYTKLFGFFWNIADDKGDIKPFEFTFTFLKKLVGFKTNVSYETRSAWIKRIIPHAVRDTEKDIEREIKNACL